MLTEGHEVSFPRGLLPSEARQGDHLVLMIDIDAAARDQASKEIRDLQKRLRKSGEQG